MQNNRATLKRLFAEEAIDLQESPILDQGPPLPRLRFRPDIPAGKKGWGAKGDLDLGLIGRLAKEK